jgi:hypothetical protein
LDTFIQRFLSGLKRMRASWLSFPGQVKRIVIFIVLLVAVFVPARNMLIPDDFGLYGHYRASALEENAALPIKYAGRQACFECHDDVVETKLAGYHKNLSCEICHGAAAQHAEEPDEFTPDAPRERGKCPLCHGYLASRPTGFPQIVTASHNPRKPCISCHDPHDPVPPETPKDCEACHAAIARTKAVSHHVYLGCSDCHTASEEHRINPRQNPPSKPSSRAECGRCHADGGEGSEDTKRVDMDVHGSGYVCWQCHYPHMPEAR